MNERGDDGEARVTYPIDPALNHDCDRMHLERWEMEEVVVPGGPDGRDRVGIRVVVHGRQFESRAVPLEAFVGGVKVRYLRIDPAGRWVEGVLLEEPEPGAPVDVVLGRADRARHPDRFEPDKVARIGLGKVGGVARRPKAR